MTGRAELTPAMRECLDLMESFANHALSLSEFYDEVDLFEERVRNIDGATLDARVLRPIAESLGYICATSRAAIETLEDTIAYVRDRHAELSDPDWRTRVASGWWPYGDD